MLIRALVLWCVTVAPMLAPVSADELASGSLSRTVGSVFGKSITAKDIGLTMPIDPEVEFDANDSARWELMERIVTVFGKPVMDRFVEKQKIEATADEVAKFNKTMRTLNERQLRETEDRLAKIKSQLSSPDVADEAKAKLKKEKESLEQVLQSLRGVAKDGAPDDIAGSFIVAWKIERDLHRTYGGRVIFQQAGPEALDARRMLYEAAEKKGDLKFDDPNVRHLFYYYSKMQHVAIEAKALERPWFLGDDK